MTCCQYKHSAKLEQGVALVQSARSVRWSIGALVWSARSVRRSIKGEVYMLFICANVSRCRKCGMQEELTVIRDQALRFVQDDL